MTPDSFPHQKTDSPDSDALTLFQGLKDISVIVPVYECTKRLVGHRRLLQNIAPLVGEVIWVATPSTDGSHEQARQAATETGGIYLEVPPGLYGAWNTGITRATGRFLYISTVGETITPAGLQAMRRLMQEWEADICFSPPRLEPDGPRAREATCHWPIFRFARNLRFYQNRVVPVPLLARLQILSGVSCLLGSCASCLFRTGLFNRNPFPEDFGHYGDTAWWYQNLVRAKTIYHSEVVSSFHVHDFSRRTIRRDDLDRCMEILAIDYQHRFPSSPLPGWARQLQHSRDRLDELRRPHPLRFWWLSPRTWFWRIRRELFTLRVRSNLEWQLRRSTYFSRQSPQTPAN